MSLVSITGVDVISKEQNNFVDDFREPFGFKIQLNCMEHLESSIEFNLIYVGSSESSAYDQVVDSVEIGPGIPAGNHEFDFVTENGVNPTQIQEGHLLGPTVVILNATYNEQEFVRVGYYVNVAYDVQEMNENPPSQVDFNHLKREILASEPRVTRFKINWTNNGEKYSIADNAMERGGQNVGTGMSQEMMMMGCGDENMPPNMDLLKQAGQGQNFISGDRMEALLSGFNENSNGPGGFGTSSFKPGYGAEPYETSMDGVSR